jgi:glycerol-3-phosphate dehydrogenase (NAD(P)+)
MTEKPKKGFTVLGAGSWGTTLANLLDEKGCKVRLWARSAELSKTINEKRENGTYLPGVRLSENIEATSSLEEALGGSSLVVCAVPSHGIRKVFEEAKKHLTEACLIVSASKGIEEGTRLPASGILIDVLGNKTDIVVLSGPTFAREVSAGLPACVCAASRSDEASGLVQNVFSTAAFRVYTNSDVTGVELGGALKNTIALASGISDGLGLGYNARAALITRGLAEISRLGVKLGARAETFSGLSGLGDLVLTCTGELSRNRTVGLAIGKGQALEDIVGSMKMVAEGVRTTKGVRELSKHHGVEMPITGEVYRVLYEKRSPKEAVMELMMRELKGE